MADYNNTRDSSLPDPASPGFRDGDTITLQNGSKFSRQSGRWEPVRFQTVGQQSKEVPVFTIFSDSGVVNVTGGVEVSAGDNLKGAVYPGFGGSGGVTTVFVGDSLIGNGWLQNLKTAVDEYGPYYYDDGTATGTRFARTEDYGFAAWAEFLADGAFGSVINAGIGGNTALDIFDRVDADVLAYRPLLVVDECGTNDLVAGATADQVIERKSALFAKYRSIGAKIITADISPRSGFDATMRGHAVAVNRWLYQQAALCRDLSVFPLSSILADHASITGGVSAARTTDDTHPNNLGAFLGGKLLVDQASKALFLPQRESIWTGDAFGADSANAVIRNSNPGMSYTTGGTANAGVSGQISDGFTCSRLVGTPTVVASIVERPDGRGFAQRLAITFAAASDAVEFGIPTASSRFHAGGRKIGVSARIEIAAGSADVVNRMICYASAAVGGVTYQPTALNQQSSTRRANLPCGSGLVRGLMRSPRIQVPAGAASSFSTQLRIYASGAGTVTLDISEYKLTQHP